MTLMRGKLTGVLISAQALIVLLIGLFLEYGDEAGPASNNTLSEPKLLNNYYAMYQDVQVMMLVGFGFLYQFLKRYGYSSLGITFLILSFVIEWSLLVNGLFGMIATGKKAIINIRSLLFADFAAASVLISLGTILGVASPTQLVIMAALEVVFYNINQFVGTEILGAIDVGGSIFVHTFSGYFGLVIARILYKKSQTASKKKESQYNTDINAMIGTSFLWIFWPSFNSAPLSDNERHRAVINTVLSLSACTVVTIAISAVVNKKGKLNMVHIQNATLAGGVMMGASANLILQPFAALSVGCSAAVVTVISFDYLQPYLLKKIKLHDTCGVHNLHVVPGILGAITSAIVIAVATRESYMESYDKLFSRKHPSPYRIKISQVGAQFAALALCTVIALITGAVTGFIMKMQIWDNINDDELYEDNALWMMERGEFAEKSIQAYAFTNNIVEEKV